MAEELDAIDQALMKYDWPTKNRILAEAMSELRGAKFESKLPDDPEIQIIKDYFKSEAEAAGDSEMYPMDDYD